MGAVYVAHDPVLGRMVAIKLFAADLDLPDAADRFKREARAAAALAHPNVVTVHDFGDVDGQPFIVMEYVPGENLAQIIRRKAAVAIADKLRWIEELCVGLGYAHGLSLLHRDIKPANLMIDRTGRLKILDFGIARLMGTASRTSVAFGTPGYMAPEQIRGEEIDRRADLFSAGVVAYELLTYSEAFPGDTVATITHRVLTADPAALDRLVPELDAETSAVIRRALSKDPAARYEDAAAMCAAFAQVRRRHEGDGAWTAASVPAPEAPARTVAVTGSGSNGPSPVAAPSPATASPMATPLPTPSTGARTDREDLARRRNLQVNAALTLAHSRLAERDFDGALEACQQALLLDESHPGAIAIERQIQEALVAGTARDALTGTAADGGFALSGADRVTTRAPIRRVATLAGAVVLAAAATAYFLYSGRGAAAPAAAAVGTLVLEAAPWAAVLSVRSADGATQPLPEPAATPLSLRLPAGTYDVVMAGPPSEPESRQFSVQVQAGSVAYAPVVRFRAMSPEEYFARHDLSAGASGVPAAAAGPPGQ
jgi:hypothetical protein